MEVRFDAPDHDGEEGKVAIARSCKLDNGEYGIVAYEGTFFVSGDRLLAKYTRASCGYMITDADLELAIFGSKDIRMTSDGSSYRFARMEESAKHPLSSGEYGCFDKTGAFTPREIRDFGPAADRDAGPGVP